MFLANVMHLQGHSMRRRRALLQRYALMNGLTAVEHLVASSSVLSNASGAGVSPRARRMSAACRASTWTIEPGGAEDLGAT